MLRTATVRGFPAMSTVVVSDSTSAVTLQTKRMRISGDKATRGHIIPSGAGCVVEAIALKQYIANKRFAGSGITSNNITNNGFAIGSLLIASSVRSQKNEIYVQTTCRRNLCRLAADI
jgi:hypothetical protein